MIIETRASSKACIIDDDDDVDDDDDDDDADDVDDDDDDVAAVVSVEVKHNSSSFHCCKEGEARERALGFVSISRIMRAIVKKERIYILIVPQEQTVVVTLRVPI